MLCAGVVRLVERGRAFHNHRASHGGDNREVELLRLRELLCLFSEIEAESGEIAVAPLGVLN